jgi:hypothetical protein
MSNNLNPSAGPSEGAPGDTDSGLTELMMAHLDDVTGGLAARHNSWKQTV